MEYYYSDDVWFWEHFHLLVLTGNCNSQESWLMSSRESRVMGHAGHGSIEWWVTWVTGQKVWPIVISGLHSTICHLTSSLVFFKTVVKRNCVQSSYHRSSTGNETWSHRHRRSARWPLENNLNVWWAQVLHTEIYVFYVSADDTSMTSLVISDHVLLRRNQSQRSCFAVIG